jgi:hypothetical protein
VELEDVDEEEEDPLEDARVSGGRRERRNAGQVDQGRWCSMRADASVGATGGKAGQLASGNARSTSAAMGSPPCRGGGARSGSGPGCACGGGCECRASRSTLAWCASTSAGWIS